MRRTRNQTYSNIKDVQANATHVLLGADTLLRRPLERSNTRILDFVEVLHTLGDIDEQVGAGRVGAETPNLTRIGDVPAILVREDTGAGLEIVTRGDLTVLDGEGELLFDRQGLDVQTIVLVLRFREGDDGGLGLDGLTVTDNGLGDLEGHTGVIILEILECDELDVGCDQRRPTNLQADLQVELTGTGDDVLTRVSNPCLDARIRLGETLQTFNELGKVRGVLDLDSDLHDGGDGELHDLHVVGRLGSGEGTGLEQELVDTDEADDVAGRAVLDGLDVTTHHEHGALDGLDEQVFLLAGEVVGALNADLGTGADGTREDTTKGVETSLVGRRHHLRNVAHEGALGVAVTDSNGRLVVHGTFVEGLATVALCGGGGGKVDDYHLQEGVTGGQELAHDDLEEGFALEITLILRELDLELLEHGRDVVLLEVHDGLEDLKDGVQDELAERALQRLAVSVCALGRPLAGGRVEEVVAPELDHHLLLVDTETLGVAGGELTEGETPSMEARAESNGTLLGVDLDVTESLVVVGGDDDVDGLDCALEGLVEVLLGHLQLEESAIDLVDDDDRLDTLGQRLAEHGLGLHADTLNTVDDDEGTVRHTESGSDF